MTWSDHRIEVISFLPRHGKEKSHRSSDESHIYVSKPPQWIEITARRIQSHLSGKPDNFKDIPLSFEKLTDFQRKIYKTLQSIEPGRTISYGLLAKKAGFPGAGRAVGSAMARNPFSIIVPCHRVIKSDGTIGGFTSEDGIKGKLKLLEIEGLSSETFMPQKRAVYTLTKALVSEAVLHLKKQDGILGKFISKCPPCDLKVNRFQSTFHALLESIVYQQLTGRAAATIFERLRSLCGSKTSIRPLDVLRTDDEELRAVGLSRQKIAAVRDLAEKALNGSIPEVRILESMSDADIVEKLTSIRGIGRWSVEMMLIFRMGRPDILARDDYGLRKGLASIYKLAKLPTPKELEMTGQRWRPWRTIASWYLWRAAETKTQGNN